jgi:hypothetical protein
LTPSVVIPKATTLQRPLMIDAVEHQHCEADVAGAPRHQIAEPLARPRHERPPDRGLRCRPRRPLDVLTDGFLRTRVPPRRHAGEHPLEHDTTQRIAIGEVLVGRQRHLLAVVGAAHPRALHRHASAAERHAAVLMAVTHRAAIGVVAALRTDDLLDLLVHQLGQHAEPDADAQCK